MGSPSRVIAIDWSGAREGAARSIWLAEAADGRLRRLENGRSREQIAEHLIEEAARDPALVVGFDFAFSVPEWYLRTREIAGPRQLWAVMEREADALIKQPQAPFWGTRGKAVANLGRDQEFRRTDLEMPATSGIRPKSVFQLIGSGQVGPGSLRGMPILRRLSEAGFSIWPFDAARQPAVVEIYPRVLTGPVRKMEPGARAEHLLRHPEIDASFARLAASDDSAFDAAVPAVVMARHATELAALEAEPRYALEGRIWRPEPGLDSSI